MMRRLMIRPATATSWKLPFFGIVLFSDLCGGCCHFIFGCGIGIDAQFSQFGKRIAADLFLFTQFQRAHNNDFNVKFGRQMYEFFDFYPAIDRKIVVYSFQYSINLTAI